MTDAIERVDSDEERFSNALSARLLSFTSKQSIAIVESVHGNGLEAWWSLHQGTGLVRT